MSQDPRTRLGPFQLLDPIAAGGMGEVWDALHLRSGLRVAVKRIRVDVSPSTLRSFAREVRTAASLDHPAVVRVLDHGVEDTGPWLAMERARQTLAETQVWADWYALRDAWLAVLDALAAIHARGLCHRDIKPANVLDVDGAWKLTDFGIAHALADTEGGGRAGTPLYMAPEQVLGSWRDLVPQTDLYALGATAWHGATGAPVFDGADLQEVLRGHLQRSPGPFTPRIAVPEDLETWLRTCLNKAPEDRFRCAADAAEALLGLSAPERMGDGSRFRAEAGATFSLTGMIEELPPPPVDGVPRPILGAARPIPSSWRRGRRNQPSAEVRDAGLGLLHLRDPEPVGREAERDALWSALAQSASEPVVVVLTGAVGSGRATLARWLERRARELCALRTAWLQPEELDALPLEDDPERGPALLILRGEVPLEPLQERIGAARCLVLVVAERPPPPGPWEHVHLGPMPDSELALALDALLPLDEPTLQRLLVEAEGLPGRARAILASWADQGALEPGPDGFRTTASGPIPRAALDGLEPEALDLLVGAAILGGRVPVGIWLEAATSLGLPLGSQERLEALGALLPTADGEHVEVRDAALTLALREHALHAGTDRAWREAWCEGLTARAQDIRDRGEEQAAVAMARRARQLVRGLEGPIEARAVRVLGLLQTSGGLLRQAIQTLTEAVERYQALGQPDPLTESLCNLGGALTRAGRLQEAEACLVRALELPGTSERSRAIAAVSLGNLYDRTGQPELARKYLHEAMVAWDALGDRYGQCLTRVNLAGVLDGLGRLDEALQLYDEGLRDWPGSEGTRVFQEIGRCGTLRRLGRIDEALAATQPLVAWCEAREESVSIAVALLGLGELYADLVRLDEARSCTERAAVIFADRGVQGQEATARVNLAQILRLQGDLDGAARSLDAGLELARAAGSRYVEAMAIREEALLALARGNADLAERRATDAVARLTALGATSDVEEAWWVKVQASIALGHHREAKAGVDSARELATTRGVPLERDWDTLHKTLSQD